MKKKMRKAEKVYNMIFLKDNHYIKWKFTEKKQNCPNNFFNPAKCLQKIHVKY